MLSYCARELVVLKIGYKRGGNEGRVKRTRPLACWGPQEYFFCFARGLADFLNIASNICTSIMSTLGGEACFG